jgi:hypothetical protein
MRLRGPLHLLTGNLDDALVSATECHVGAAVAVGATAAAAAAAQAAQAANAPGAPDIDVPTFTRREKAFNEQTRQVLDQGRTQAQLGSGLLSRLEPELLQALGFDVQTSSVDPAILQSAEQRVADLQGQIAQREQGITDARGRKRRGGSQKARKENRRDRNRLQSELQLAQEELGRLQANPSQVTGISRTPSEAEQQQAGIETGLGSRVLAALAGDVPANPALVRDFAEQEKVLRSRLSRDFGPEFEATTLGNSAIRDFQARRDEAFEQDRRATLVELTGLQSGLSSDILNRTLARQEGASAIGTNRFRSSEALQGIGQAFVNAQQPFQALRGQKSAVSAEQAKLDAEAQAREQALLAQAGQSAANVAGIGAGNLAGGIGSVMQAQRDKPHNAAQNALADPSFVAANNRGF